MTEEKGEDINFKKWITKVISLMIVLSIITYGIQTYLKIDLIFDIIVGVMLILLLFFLHEYLHFYTAKKLGYKPEWYRTRFMMGFDIDTKIRTDTVIQSEKGLSQREKKEKHLRENKKIAIAPYYICIPLAIVLLALGFYINFNGFIFSGALVLIGHAITLPMEAKEV